MQRCRAGRIIRRNVLLDVFVEIVCGGNGNVAIEIFLSRQRGHFRRTNHTDDYINRSFCIRFGFQLMNLKIGHILTFR